MATENKQLKSRGDTAANWTSGNPTPLARQLCVETDTFRLKVGDGSTAWTSLSYIAGPMTAAGLALLDDADASAQRTTLGLVIGTNVQAYDAELAAIAGLVSAADRGIYFTGSGTASLFTLTAAARTVLDDATTGDMLTTLGAAAASHSHAGSDITSGTVDPARLGSGASITTKYLRGDSTWQTISGGGDALVANPLSQFAATTSAQLAGVISDETGSGALVFATSPTLVTPVLGVAAATSINKVALTAPATGATLTLADGSTLTVSASATISNGTHSGTNTGDQTSIVGISGTKAQFDTACSDGNFLFVGDITQYTDELAQDAVGAMVDSTLVYTDGTPLLSRAALTGDVTASAGSNATTIANGAVTPAKMSTAAAKSVVTCVIDGGTATPTVGTKVYVRVPFAGTITKWTILADASGSAVVDVWKDTYANFPPTVADTIAASAKPTLSTAQKNEDATLTGWTTSVSSGDVLGFNLDSVTTCKRITVQIEITRT